MERSQVRRRHDADRLRLSPAVVPPLRVPVADLLVRDVRAVGGHAAQIGLGQRKGRGQPALGRDRVELPELRGDSIAPRLEEDVPIGRPPLHDIRRRMPGEPRRLSALGRHEIDVRVAPVLAGKRDPAPVRAEGGVGLGAVGAGEPCRVAPVAPDQPEVVGVGEDDVGGAHVGLAQEARALGVGGGGGEGGEQGGEENRACQGEGQGAAGRRGRGARHRLGLRADGEGVALVGKAGRLRGAGKVGGVRARRPRSASATRLGDQVNAIEALASRGVRTAPSWGGLSRSRRSPVTRRLSGQLARSAHTWSSPESGADAATAGWRHIPFAASRVSSRSISSPVPW